MHFFQATSLFASLKDLVIKELSSDFFKKSSKVKRYGGREGRERSGEFFRDAQMERKSLRKEVGLLQEKQ